MSEIDRMLAEHERRTRVRTGIIAVAYGFVMFAVGLTVGGSFSASCTSTSTVGEAM